MLTKLLNDFQLGVLSDVLANRYACYWMPGGRGGGKTHVAMLILLLISENAPGSYRIVIGGTSLTDIRANVEDALLYWAGLMGVYVKWPNMASELKVGKRTCEVRGL